ncbi:hypothetical protein M1L60_42495 [Actinoplanes sp. TRM 88003]|uniref:ABC transporter permease n=1 Tax=Paractinoplanes aksuensis TaxID=2939490 RepID=A0ABT1E2K1_9ACTN|nr:hypothetical protein [Actinoplanes aksuensis]MCO8277267.1 hypothetical protein [Actinoplanes aksuensis]
MSALTTRPALTFSRVLAADRRRLRTVRSTWWFAAAAVVLTVGIGVFPAVGVLVGALPGSEVETLAGVLGGISVAEILVAVFAVRTVTAEAPLPVFTAVPRRATVVLARAVVVATAVLAVASALVLGTFAVVHVLLGSAGVDLSLTAPGVARALAGAVLHLTVVAALAVAAGWLLRSAVAAVAAVLGLYYVLPVLGFLLPAAAAATVLPWLPGSAAATLMGPEPTQPWAPALALIGYAVSASLIAVAVVRRRDI